MIRLRFLDSVPSPWRPAFPYALVVLGLGAVAAQSNKAGDIRALPMLCILVSGLLAAYGFQRYGRRVQPTDTLRDPETGVAAPRAGIMVLAISGLAAVVGLVTARASVADILMCAVLFALLSHAFGVTPHRPPLTVVILPVTLALFLLLAAAFCGDIHAGVFPAFGVFMLSLITLTTRRIELASAPDESASRAAPLVRRSVLGWISVLFFLFGVVSLWPWLGTIYGDAYLWILIIGVLFPAMFLWGRLRHPRGESPRETLARFNRLMPYLGLVLLIAVAVG